MDDSSQGVTPAKTWLFVSLQWVTAITSILLSAQRWPVLAAEQRYYSAITVIVILLSMATTVRWFVALRSSKPPSFWWITFSAIIPILIVSSTNWWQSPYVFLLLNSVIVAAYSLGFAVTVTLSVVASLVISVPYMLASVSTTNMTDQVRVGDSLRWSTVLILIGVASSYAIRISDANANRSDVMREIEMVRLQNANSLLSELHGVAKELPTSLDEEEIIGSSLGRLKEMLFYEGAVLLLPQSNVSTTDGIWRSDIREGEVELRENLTFQELPEVAKKAVLAKELEVCDGDDEDLFLSSEKKVCVFSPLVIRQECIGCLYVERSAFRAFTTGEISVLRSFTSSLALAIDNARWFLRLRIMGAEEERSRIARDLHDSVGQSLVFLGMSAENLLTADDGEIKKEKVEEFKEEIRNAISEVRGTLYDLRTDISPSRPLASLLLQYAVRVENRSAVSVHVDVDENCILPIVQEKELWRIAQEAIINAEKHSACKNVEIAWGEVGDGYALSVADDGKGFTAAHGEAGESYGITGMKERAFAIGAQIEIAENPEGGTTVVCFLPS